jgi:hypothetical protein
MEGKQHKESPFNPPYFIHPTKPKTGTSVSSQPNKKWDRPISEN